MLFIIVMWFYLLILLLSILFLYLLIPTSFSVDREKLFENLMIYETTMMK